MPSLLSSITTSENHPEQGAVASRRGPLGRLGVWSVTHCRHVFVSWLLLIVVMAVFAPSVEKALSGAGWQADGSASVQARALAQRYFAGQASSAIEVVVHAKDSVSSPGARAVIAKVERTLAADPRVASVIAPR